ncbi:MAG: transglutaminase domain-containing protein [Candidatus Micrarchaeota archaeon]|nr:transglutaminase domain-containing protein [Candidatus Micrarchaeota archaeon]MDE1849342.1 transglutaminase domain-containing protein [Candidatus Micrarchaeota archaeon]
MAGFTVVGEGVYKAKTVDQSVSVSPGDRSLVKFLEDVARRYQRNEGRRPGYLDANVARLSQMFNAPIDSRRLFAFSTIGGALQETITYGDTSGLYATYGTAPVPLGEFVSAGVGKCRELSILSHVALAALGTETDIVSGFKDNEGLIIGRHTWLETTQIAQGVRVALESTDPIGVGVVEEGVYLKHLGDTFQKLVRPA